MSTIGRFYVEKKHGLDNEAATLFEDIKESLQINELLGVRILNRYDIEGLDERFIGMVKATVLSEPPVDVLYEEEFPIAGDEKYFVKQYLPGQFDQCADSLIQCVQIISGGQNINAQAAKVYVLKGNLSGEEFKRIAEYCYNPVDSRLGGKEKPKTLEMNLTRPEDIKTLDGFIDKTDEQIDAMRKDEGYAMSTKDLIHCRDYFASEKRNPTVTEMKVIDTYWSDHCRHTTFLTELGGIKIDEGYYSEPIKEAYDTYLSEREGIYKNRKVPITLMDMAVMGMKSLRAKGMLDDLDISDEINACSIEIEVDVDGKPEAWLLMFKNETHNHPTEIEPYGGAATCLGGAIRDPLSGRSYVYQAMRITGAGNVKAPVSETLKGKLPQRKITTEAAHGFSSYGNQIGLATGHVREIYDDGFVAKRMEIGAVIGAAPKQNVVREKPAKGDAVIVVGGRTGRDGCGGATGSSKEHSVDSINDCGAEVQKGNAPTERKLQRLFRNGDAARLIKRCNDFGAGGVCVAIGELADSLTIDLDKILKKYEGLDGTELAISESQERMAVVVGPDDIDKFIEYADKENLEAVAVAEITDCGNMKMLWRGKEIVNIKRSFLNTNGAPQTASATIKCPDKASIIKSSEIFEGGIRKSFINAVSDMNACSQKGLVERFDSTIGAATVLMPFGGKTQNSPEDVMAAKIPVLNGETSTSSLMSAAYDPRIFKLSPFHGGIYAVVESVARLVAAGADHKKIRLSFQEYFEKMTESPYTWGKPAAALLGALKAQLGLLAPSIGGKDSMSGTFGDMSVPPVLTSFAVAVEKTGRIIDVAFKGENNVYIFTPDYDKFDIVGFDSLKKGYDWFYGFSGGGKVFAASAVKRFGIAETVSKMCFGNEKGFEFDVDFINRHGEESLFMPLYGSIIFEADEEIDAENVELIGKTNNGRLIKINGEQIELGELVTAWQKPLEKIFPTKIPRRQKVMKEFESATGKKTAKYEINKSGKRHPKPKVFIPTFPGTNCEYDSARAFESAGAEANIFVFRNIKMEYIDESIRKMAEQIRNSQIIMIPGGFSAGDEPNGSAKFIASVFRNPHIKEAVNEHLTKNDGLILGVCNGFQALIKLGLLPNGQISEITEHSPTIYYNEIGRHISQIVDTKVTSVNSPFLSGSKIGDIVKVAVSHGEGRFLITEHMYKRLAENGQIASVYVDDTGKEAMEPPHNPNGAMYAVEGILSPCGRVFGKMGHNERMGIDVYKNVAGTADYNDNPYNSKIFESAVKYFM